MFDTKSYTAKADQVFERFEGELKKIRTGRAHPDMLSRVVVEAYGSKMPLNQVAMISVPEPQLLQLTPFDPSQIQAVAAAIRNDQSVGLNPTDDGRVIRVPVPPLTEDRRKQFVKLAAEKVEDAKIALRGVRQDALKDAKRQKDAKTLSEDDVKRIEKDIDAMVAACQGKIDASLRTKEQEILTI